MLKHIHLLFVAVVVIVFIGRVLIAEFKPELLAHKYMKIAPHVLAGILLLSGIGLVFEGAWLSRDFAWIVAKLLAMFAFIGLGIVTIKSHGDKRWYAFAGSLLIVFYIVKVAFTKQVFPFF